MANTYLALNIFTKKAKAEK